MACGGCQSLRNELTGLQRHDLRRVERIQELEAQVEKLKKDNAWLAEKNIDYRLENLRLKAREAGEKPDSGEEKTTHESHAVIPITQGKGVVR